MKAASNPTTVDFGEITFAVPAQTFGITCAVSTEQTLPVVTESALRLIWVCDALKPQHLQEFFGFSEREVEQVIQSLVSERLLQWEDDQLELTHYARSLFLESPDSVPRLTRIKDWAGEVAFELVGFTPVNPTDGAKRARLMVEVPADDPEKESRSKLWAERSFQENFDRINRGPRHGRAETIYKISEVEAGTRFLLAVPCTFSVSLDEELAIRRSLPDDYMSERLELSQAITGLLAGHPTPDNSQLSQFAKLFPSSRIEYYIDKTGKFDLRAFLLHAVSGDWASTKATPLIGSLHLNGNAKRLENCVRGLPRETESPLTLHWVAPRVAFWARSKAMRPLVAELRNALKAGSEKPDVQDPTADESATSSSVKILMQGVDEGDRHRKKLYGQTLPEVFGTSATILDGKIEMVTVPNRFMCALYHYQLRHAVTVPIGFMSTEEDDVRTAEQLLGRLTEPPARLATLTRDAPAADTIYRSE